MPTPSGLPLVVTLLGNPAAETETLVDAEAGYRLEIGTTASIDVTASSAATTTCARRRPRRPSSSSSPSPQILVSTQFGNLLTATTRGLEVAGHWTPVPAWRLDGSYTAFHLTPHLAATSQDPRRRSEDGSAPRGAVAAAVGVFAGRSRDAQRRALPRRSARAVPGGRLHARRRQRRVAVHQPSVRHGDRPEPLRCRRTRSSRGADSLLLATQVPRSASLRLRWTF